ncbi:MAG: hypothetical protein IPP31_13670 [Chitinophagaceae bacterium]|nr:hypothetical protein [Chitinophagaceae bacterium]
MKKWFNRNWLYIAGALLGAAAGYLYWQQVGCASGTCSITSKPLNSTLYGALMGSLLLGMFKRDHKEPQKENHDI